jgi:anaerobic selenocysteine-containing dehydrogenase
MAAKVRSVCALDCPDTCALIVTIDDAGHATKLAGDPAHPFTRGFLCAKVTKYLDRQYHPERLLHPLRRTGAKGEGRFQQITWDDALDEIAQKLTAISREHGPESILPYSYAGTMGVLNGSGMDRRFFHRLGASRLDRTICASTGGAALELSQGARLGMPPEHFAHSRLILAWGANILGTNVHLWPEILAARRNGARFYVIDPVKNKTGRLADKHFALYPGSDLALALGLAHVILRDHLEDTAYIAAHTNGIAEMRTLAAQYPPERVAALTGIAPDEIELLAREYATQTPAAIRVNYGVQRSDRGGSAVRAIAALPVLTGAWRHQGGGLQLTTSGAFQLNSYALERPDLQNASPLGRPARLVNMSHLGDALLHLNQPPIKAMVVYNSNPAAIAPHQSKVTQGLQREDLFTVVLEQMRTDTADYADILLPVTTFLEHTDLYKAYGHYHLQLARPALPAAGETKSNVEIFRLLAKRMGFPEPCFDDSEDDLLRTVLDTPSEYLHGITLERLDAEKSIPLNLTTGGQPFLPFATGGFKTPSQKFEFGASHLHYSAPFESRLGEPSLLKKFPLELISSKNDDGMNSTFGYRTGVSEQTSQLSIHAADAAPRGIVNGAKVKVFNDRGACYFTARITSDVQTGVLRAPSVGWHRGTRERLGINHLTSERLTDIGGGPTFFSCLVEVSLAN